MSVILLDKNPLGVTVETLDVRNGRAVDDTADEVRARMIGQSLIDWWRFGGKWWRSVFHPRSFLLGRSLEFDLRQMLLRALTDNLRISCVPRYLGCSGPPDWHSLVAQDIDAHAFEIGRDLMAWWADEKARYIAVPGPQGAPMRVDVRLLLNQAFRGWKVEHDRDRAAGRKPTIGRLGTVEKAAG
jgi:hypothetical protein